ncbi:MAG TPA: TonB-dependent receptor [Opitutus sp.]|nr:TonB-dependent receptor [Opitutus sp.]
MRLSFRLACCLAFPAGFAVAQTAPDSEPVVTGEPYLVEATRLVADAAGTTRVQLDQIAPPLDQSLANLSGRVANFHVDSGGAGSFGDLITLRGLANTPYFSDPSVTLYFDDLPLTSSFTYPTGLFGFATATLYRGPQATAFGRAGEAGVLVLSSTEPGPAPAGELRASAGNYDAWSAALTARSARMDNVDATAAAAFAQRDGYITNTQLGTRVDDVKSTSASARVRFRPTATSEFTVQVLANRQRNGAQPLVPIGGPLFTVARDAEGRTDIDFAGVAVKGAFDTAIGPLTATTSYTDWKMSPYENFLVLPPPLDSRVVQSQRTWNEELHLSSAARAALDWSLGAWFSDSRTDGDTFRQIPNLFPIEASSYNLKARTAAVFGQLALVATGPWHVTAGLRAETVQKDFDRSQTVPGPGRFTAAKTFDRLLPKLAASYAISSDTTASASVSLGTKPGGWSAFTDSPALAPFKAERVLAFDAGIDTALANKTVKLAARAFVYDIDNYQVERSFTYADYLVVNAPRARSLGAEFEASWHPTPGWTFAATLGVTDITLRDFTDPFTHVNYDGKRAPYAPSYDANLSAAYRDPSGWFAAAELTAIGRTYFDEGENPAFAADAHTTLDARLGYDAARWRVALFTANLANASYYSLIIPGVGHAVPGTPRTYGVEAAVKW